MPHQPRPFPVQVEVEFLDRLSEPVREGRAKSVSEIIRTALERYDFSNIVVMHPAQVSISVRLAPEIRRSLKQISRAKHTSIGQLVRAAVEAYLPQLETGAVNQLEIPNVPVPPVVEPVLLPKAKPVKARTPAKKKKPVGKQKSPASKRARSGRQTR